MIQIAIGVVLMAIGVAIILAVRTPGDDLERAPVASTTQVLLSNFVLLLIMAGGALLTLAIF